LEQLGTMGVAGPMNERHIDRNLKRSKS